MSLLPEWAQHFRLHHVAVASKWHSPSSSEKDKHKVGVDPPKEIANA